ncbi:lipid-A-disaccharide synthase [Pelagibacterium limicola]|uniref:lipid-A-disaccharide synthase n=1 Tax=Pelagibacterium limicola TaxID=2791022 RepID=UPI0018AFFB7E|nr:lipid-A-disaccharide synthase [Pelagibacterium limicola]
MTSAFILAGEASGDRIGAELIAGLRKRADIRFSGVGGEAMTRQGLDSLFPIDDLAVMGYADVIARLPLLLWRARQVVRFIERNRPDIVILIDAQVFSQVVASRLRKHGYRGRIFLYVAPAVWAWKPERAKKIASLYDEVFSVLPFEPQAMQRLAGPPTVYVGHPALARFPFRTYQPERGPLLLLPGSRRGELRRHLPLMRELATGLSQHPAITRFVIPTLSSLHAKLVREVAEWPADVEVVSSETARLQALSEAVAAFAVSGTATLELALAGVPHILTYVAEPAQVRMFEKADTNHIGLPNIIAGREVTPEILFVKKGDPARAKAAIEQLLDDTAARAGQVAAFAAIRTLMEKGAPEAPLHDPVERILSYL